MPTYSALCRVVSFFLGSFLIGFSIPDLFKSDLMYHISGVTGLGLGIITYAILTIRQEPS